MTFGFHSTMANRKKNHRYHPAERSTIISISIPKYIDEALTGHNKSKVITTLLENNIELISSANLDEVTNYKEKIIRYHIHNAFQDLEKDFVAHMTKDQLKSIEDLESTLISLRDILNNLPEFSKTIRQTTSNIRGTRLATTTELSDTVSATFQKAIKNIFDDLEGV